MDRLPRTCCRLAFLLAAALAACTSGSTVGTAYVKTQSVGPSGATITVSASDDQALAGTSISIPAGALTSPVMIKIGPSSQAVNPTGTKAAGPVVEFLPDGQMFSKPVTITLPVHAATFVEAVESTGQSRRIAIASLSQDGTLATFQTSGFTRFGGCSDATCQSDSDCPAGEVCDNPPTTDCCPANYDMYSCTYPDGGQGFACHNPMLGCASSTTCGQGCDPVVSGTCSSSSNGGGMCVPAQDGGSGPDAGLVCRTDSDCGMCGSCVNGMCAPVPGCGMGDGGPNICDCVNIPAGMCAGPKGPGPCFCPTVVPCDDGGMAPDAGTSCQADSDCGSCSACVNGMCAAEPGCGACGGEHQPCCAGDSCNSATLVCSGGSVCETCGQQTAQPCCANGDCPGGADLLCNEGVCVYTPPPGSKCAPCVDGGCDQGLVCQNGRKCIPASTDGGDDGGNGGCGVGF